MQALDPSGTYIDEQVAAALAGLLGTRTMIYRYDRLSAEGDYLGALGNVLGGKVANNALASIKRTATFTLRETGELNYLRDRIQPFARLTMPDGGFVEWPLGVFVLETPKRVLDDVDVVTREVAAYDLAVVLNDDRTTDRYSIAAGTLYTSAVATIAGDAGLDVSITPSALTLPVAAEWPPGTTKLRIVNDLLAAINYESVSFDELGRLVARPYQSPAERAVEYTYADGEASVRLGGAEQELDLFGVPNRVTLVKSEADQGAPLVATVTNADPLSPTSTVARGRTISEYVEDDDAPDLTTLQAKAARRLFEASQIFEAVTFETAAMPMHGNLDVLALNLPGLAVDARYVEQTWELPLEVGATMTHRARRVVTI